MCKSQEFTKNPRCWSGGASSGREGPVSEKLLEMDFLYYFVPGAGRGAFQSFFCRIHADMLCAPRNHQGPRFNH